MKKIISLNLSTNDLLAPQPGSDSPDTITEGNLDFLEKCLVILLMKHLSQGECEV